VPLPLYGVEEVTYTFDLIDPRANYEETLELAPGVRATFRNAGHILGAAFVELEVRENGSAKRVTFSGDLGNPGRPVIPDAVLPHPSDLVLVETTYGDRDHRSVGDSNAELGEVVRKTLGQGGNVVIPTFALERAQDVLFALGELRRAGEISQCPIYLDSPLAIDITSVYRRYPDSLGEPLNRMISSGEKPFVFEGVSLTRAVDESKRINGVSGAIILAGSGMCHGGRILHHLRHNLWREDSSVVLVGYQAKGTLGRALVDGAERVHIYGEEIQVRAAIHTINGFSAHADRTGLIHWLEPCQGGRLRLIHGEMRALAAFKTLAEDRLHMKAEIARLGESVSV
jgi:metallo-beta-lactamase family protein